MPISNRGFAGMDKDKQKEIARAGGKASHISTSPQSSTTGKRAAGPTTAAKRGGQNGHNSM